MAEHPIILVAAVSTADELNSYLSNINDGASFLCIDDFDYTGELNGVRYKRCFIQGEIITYTTQYGFYYPAIQTPLQWRAWVADNFYSKTKIDNMITEKGAGKVKINDLDPEANYLKAKLGNGAGITFRVSSDNKKLIISLNTEVAPKLSSEGTWMYFDLTQNEFVDSGLKAEGVDGTSIHYVGEFVLNSTYQFNDAVRYHGKIYVANNEVQATVDPETDTENWEFLIKDGDKGDKGDKGDIGVTPSISFNKPTVNQTTGEPDITIEAAQGSTPENPVFDMTFTGIKGEKGDQGDQGDPGTDFEYAGFYESYSDLEADLSNLNNGDFVMITEGADKGKVYEILNGTPNLKVNLIGPKGDTGDTGATGNGIERVEDDSASHTGSRDPITVTFHFTDGTQGSFTVYNGAQGLPGKDFTIKKTYISIAAMEADINTTDVDVGDFVCITTGNVEDSDNAKLYVKAQDPSDQLFWNYITDLSGSQGIQGPPGANGITWYTGAGTPTTSLTYNVGDLYLDTETGDVYKFNRTDVDQSVSMTWNLLCNIRGATWSSGIVNPSSVVGFKVGDFYLNTTTSDVYKLVSSGGGGTSVSWVSICNLKGEAGATWFTTNGVPGAISGSKEGDLCLDTTTSDVYKLISSGSTLTWTLICNIKGANGTNGTNGADGADGAAAGFASTMGVTVETKAPDTNAEVTVTPDSSTPNTAKKFNFVFKIPRGADGDDGTDGNGIDGTIITYQNGSSGTTAPTGTWSSTPNPTPGTYLWTKIYFTFTEGGDATAYAVTYVPSITNIVFTATVPTDPVAGTLYVI